MAVISYLTAIMDRDRVHMPVSDMWPWGACVCVCVLVLTASAVDIQDGVESDTDTFNSSSSSLHDSWNKLVKFLLGKEYGGDDPWQDLSLEAGYQADQPVPSGGRELTVDSLDGLDDMEIWNKFIRDYKPTNDSDVTESVPGNDFSQSPTVPYVIPPREESAKVLDSLLHYQSDGADSQDDPTQGQATLAFVFDTTGSMWDDLVQVRHGAAKIMETMLQRPDKPIYDYVLVPFHDPLIGPVTVTTDHKLLMQRLNEIQIYGGGDCPEASVEAVRQALQLSRPNSYIYVFTDASSKDYHIISKVLPLIQRKQSQVVFVMTGDCGNQSHPGYEVYNKIAATSSGQVYHLNKTDVDEVLSFVRVSLQSRKVNLLSVERPPAQNGTNLQLPIDQSLKEFTVSVSGSNASIGVVDPGGQIVHPPKLTPLLNLQNVKVVNVKEPPPGLWTLQVGSDSSHTVRSTGLSGSDFMHGFSVIPTTNLAETYHRPLKSGINSVLIKATEPDNLYNLTKLELVHLNGSVAEVVPICAVPGQPGLYSGGPFTPPNELFYLSVS